MPDPADENEDQRSFALLNAYLDDLHAGRQPDRAELVRDHPELVVAIECLDAIDQLVPAPPAGSGTIHSEPTQLQLAPVGSAPTDTAAHVPLLGAFGDFDLINELGRGGMGVVYQARQKSLDRPVAVKMILASHLASPEQVERFRTEAKAAARACHPNIVGIHEIGELHGQHYFVMDYIEGQNLAELLQGGPMELEAAASCVAKIARAVHHLHQHGIVHRDLKPSNVLMDRNGEPHLTDFGLAKTLLGDSHMTHAGAIVGTPSYMSPEQAAGRVTDVGPASDVYSLGALLYDLITGQPPFRESTPLDTLVQVLEGEPRLPSELNRRIPSDLEMICLRCLEKLPEQRYRSAEDLASDLERFLRGDSVEARPPNLYMRVRRWSRREPARPFASDDVARHLGNCVLRLSTTDESPEMGRGHSLRLGRNRCATTHADFLAHGLSPESGGRHLSRLDCCVGIVVPPEARMVYDCRLPNCIHGASGGLENARRAV
jgi:serine/threonine-protein kinase